MQEAFQRAVLDAESALPSSWLPTQPDSIALTRGGRGGTDVPPNLLFPEEAVASTVLREPADETFVLSIWFHETTGRDEGLMMGVDMQACHPPPPQEQSD